MTAGPRVRGRWLRGALLAAVLAAALLGLVEIGLRAFLRASTGVWPRTRWSALHDELGEALRLYRLHPFLNTAPHAGTRVQAFGKSAGFNTLGYRSPERPLAKPAGATRVLCAGGSTTFDLLAARDEETWPWRLEERLRATGWAVEVWNAGFPGWTSLENTIAFAARDIDLRPDLVLLFQGINDLQPAAHTPFDPQYEHGHAELARRALGFDLRPLAWPERLLVVERLRDAARGPADPWRRLNADTGDAVRLARLPEAAIAVFARNVASFAALAVAGGARPVLITQTIRPRRAHLDEDRRYLMDWLPGLLPEAAPAELERLNDALRAVSSREGFDLLDARQEVDWQDDDFADPLHFSARGSEKFAAFVAGRLADHR